MMPWTRTLFSKRLVLFSAMLFVAMAHGCSCEDAQDTDEADGGVDVVDSSDVGDVGGDAVADVDTDTSDADLDAVDDADSEGDAGSDGGTDAESADADDTDTNSTDADDATSTDTGDTGDTDDTDDATSDSGDTTDDTGDATDDTGDGSISGGDCISGATGTHAVRFSWQGNGPNSTAYVDYEINELPDTSRWHVGAYSQSFSYSPVYTDTFLGAGGLELSGTVFIDVELSTDGLGPLSNATLAILGRSFNTTSPGSFEWQTFSGSGAAPSGLVANSAPYEWYLADATAALPAGDDGILLRISAGPPSNSLVVNSVEICFDEQ